MMEDLVKQNNVLKEKLKKVEGDYDFLNKNNFEGEYNGMKDLF